MSSPPDFIIDPGALRRVVRMGGLALLGRLVETALANLATRRGELESALARGDAAAAERAAHSMKSSARNLGATRLGDLAQQIEELARQDAAAWKEAARELAAADLEALAAALEPSCLSEMLAGAESEKARKKPQILLVEDNPDNRLLIMVLLEERYQMVESASAEEALLLLPMLDPDLFLIDISLPGMDGDALLAEIRRVPALAGKPAIAFTAHAMEGDRERFLAQGFDAYLSKPIVQEEILLDAVATALRQSARAPGEAAPGAIILPGRPKSD